MRRNVRERLEKTDGSPVLDATSSKGNEKETSAPASSESVKHENDSMDVDRPASSPQASDSNAMTTHAPQTSANSNPMATIPLALTAARASALASHEERALTALVSRATNIQLAKLELKLQQFAEMESVLQAERRDLERRRQQLFLDRLAFRRRMREVEEGLRRVNVSGGADSAAAMEDVMQGLWGGE
ncbi:SWI/SNF and RSC complex subunit Ssr2, partial [Cryomyces antarcticus]